MATVVRQGAQRVLVAVDAAAREVGLKPGMPVGHAQALVPGLDLVEADPVGDVRALQRLAVWCARFSPLVATDPADGLWIDATGVAHLFGGEAEMLGRIEAKFRVAGIACRAAIADTPGAAHALARYGRGGVVAVGETSAALAPLPVAALRLLPETVAALLRVGIATIGRLDALPRPNIALRFGETTRRRLDQALGLLDEPINPLKPVRERRRRLAFAEPIATPEDLARAIRRLTEDLCRDMGRAVEGVRRLELACHRVDGRIESIRIGTSQPSRDPGHLARLLTERLDQIDPGFGVEIMELTGRLTEAMPARQMASDLLAAEGENDLAPLIDRLANRLGEKRIYRVEPLESDLPERAFRRVAPLAPAKGIAWPADLPRPARLLQPPEPVQVMAEMPDHPPRQFVWRHVRHRILRADGPERVHGEWWRDPREVPTERDYFQVEDEAGGRFWLFRAGPVEAGRPITWYLHGLFA